MSKDKKDERRNRKVRDRAHIAKPYLPTPPQAEPKVVWERIETLAVSETPRENTTTEPKKRKRGELRRRLRWRRRFRLFDVLGSLMWAFVITKLFVTDIDRIILGSVAPDAMWVLDLRWLFGLAILALVLTLFRVRTLAFAVAYVVFFPAVVLLWKIPKFLVLRRSTLLASTFIAVGTSVVSRARLFVVALAIACLSGAAILSHDPTLTFIGIAGMLIALGWWLGITTVDRLHSDGFIRAQAAVINWILGNHYLEKFVTPEQPDAVALNTWTTEDATKFRDTAGNAILVRRGLLFWASAMAEFRRAPAVLLINACILVALFLQMVVVFAFVNYGLYSIDPSQFSFTREPDALVFANYSANAIFFGEIAALTPVFGWAVGMKIFIGVLGSLGVLTIVGSSVFAYRAAKTDRESDEAVAALQAKAEALQELSEEQFQMSLEDLHTKLAITGWGLLRIADWLRAKTSLTESI